jgi:HAD superfamily hydrolase (TIGR01490 family)
VQLAIFDLDGTLIRGSSERRFWRYLWNQDRQTPMRMLAFIGFLLRGLPLGPVDAIKKNKCYLLGLEVAEVDRLASAFVAAELVHLLFEPVVTRLKAHQARGDVVLLLSGTLQPIAQALAATLGIEYVCGTLCAEREGRYRASLPARHPYGGAKVALAREFAREHGLDLAQAVAYGNSRADIELLAAVREAVAVLPDRGLFTEATRRNWEILTAEKGSILGTEY